MLPAMDKSDRKLTSMALPAANCMQTSASAISTTEAKRV